MYSSMPKFIDWEALGSVILNEVIILLMWVNSFLMKITISYNNSLDLKYLTYFVLENKIFVLKLPVRALFKSISLL